MDCGCVARNERSYRFRRPVNLRIPGICERRSWCSFASQSPYAHAETLESCAWRRSTALGGTSALTRTGHARREACPQASVECRPACFSEISFEIATAPPPTSPKGAAYQSEGLPSLSEATLVPDIKSGKQIQHFAISLRPPAAPAKSPAAHWRHDQTARLNSRSKL